MNNSREPLTGLSEGPSDASHDSVQQNVVTIDMLEEIDDSVKASRGSEQPVMIPLLETETRAAANHHPESQPPQSLQLQPQQQIINHSIDSVMRGAPPASSIDENIAGDTEEERLLSPSVPAVEIHSFHREDDSNELARTMIPLIVKSDRDIMEAVNRSRLESYYSACSRLRRERRAAAPAMFTYYSAVTGGPVEASDVCGLAPDLTSLESLFRIPNFWLDICNPGPKDMEALAHVFNIHPLSTEDIETASTREKCELFRSYMFVCYCALDQDSESATFMQSFNVYILVFQHFVLSFHYCQLPSVRKIIRRLDALKSYLQLTPHWINYAILDDITDKYTPLIRSIELEVESIDELVFVISGSEQSDMLRRIASARKRVNTLQKLLVAKADVLRVIAKRLEAIPVAEVPYSASNNMNSSPAGMAAANMGGTIESQATPAPLATGSGSAVRDTMLYLSDVQDHVITMVQSLSHADSTLNRSHSNYLAQINIEITQSSNKANDAMTKLTAIASILVPLNVITGLWGMNVRVPGMVGFDGSDNYNWFVGIIVSMISISTAAYIFVRRSGLVSM